MMKFSTNVMCVLAACLVVFGSGCTELADVKNNGSMTKDDASALDGRGTDGSDLCETHGWYGDGVCDDFCINPDPDCADPCSVDSDCQADEACVDGACTQLETGCGGIAGLLCADGEYCDYGLDDMCGAGDAMGECQPMPDACTLEYAPVCGCDGATYGNACGASSAGVSVAYTGECGDAPCQNDSDCQANEACIDGECLPHLGRPECGGFTGQTCATDQYCHYEIEDICGGADALGECRALPGDCIEIYSPVCGCDGVTYGNDCDANSNGVSVASLGECPVACNDNTACDEGETCIDGQCLAPSACGGISPNPVQCAVNEFCKFPVAAMCGALDQPGTCSVMPDACPENYTPVCGCDGQTYSNTCFAASAGVSVASDGECTKSCLSDINCDPGDVCIDGRCEAPKFCGGIAGVLCAQNEFCEYDDTSMCGAADQAGTCRIRPTLCPLVLMPVCGCDGQNHGNACEANAAGTSVAYEGPCKN